MDSGKISSNETTNFKYKIIDKINKTNPYPGIYYYNNIKMCDYGIPKIIMCTGGYLMPEYDEKGEYNLSDNMIYLTCISKQNYDAFKIIINSNLITYLNKITMTDNIHGRDTVIMNLKLIDLNKIKNESDVYKIYNITSDEKKIIDLTIGNKNNELKKEIIISNKNKVSKKKTLKPKTETKITNKEIEKNIDDKFNDFKVSKKKTLKPNIIINDDGNETKEKKVIKKIRIKKSNNNETMSDT